MTTTLASARSRLRTTVEDSSGSPLWADGTLDEGLRTALDDYSQWSPAEATSTLTTADGDTTATVPAAALRVLQITDPNGWVIPEQHGDPLRYVGDLELSWSIFASTFRFSRALAAGDYTVWYLTARTFPTADDDSFDIPDSDIPLLLAGGVVYALEVRLVQEHKRGPLPARYSTALAEARITYNREWEHRRRVIRTHTLRSTN